MASGAKLRKAVTTIGLRGHPVQRSCFRSRPDGLVFSYSSCSHVSPTIETDFARRGD
jgi:hypothetical protein